MRISAGDLSGTANTLGQIALLLMKIEKPEKKTRKREGKGGKDREERIMRRSAAVRPFKVCSMRENQVWRDEPMAMAVFESLRSRFRA
ncbi:hypothetical protein U1Q18_048309 [Sarracenia purpurea var. burkii]